MARVGTCHFGRGSPRLVIVTEVLTHDNHRGGLANSLARLFEKKIKICRWPALGRGPVCFAEVIRPEASPLARDKKCFFFFDRFAPNLGSDLFSCDQCSCPWGQSTHCYRTCPLGRGCCARKLRVFERVDSMEIWFPNFLKSKFLQCSHCMDKGCRRVKHLPFVAGVFVAFIRAEYH